MSSTFFAIQTLHKTGYNKTLFNYLFISLFILTWKIVTLIKTATVNLPADRSMKVSYTTLLISWHKHIQRESLFQSLPCSAEGPSTAALARGADVEVEAVALWKRCWHGTAGPDQQEYTREETPFAQQSTHWVIINL